MSVNISLSPIPPEDALAHLRRWLKDQLGRRSRGQEGRAFQFDIFSVIHGLLEEEQARHRRANPTGMIAYALDAYPNSESFQDAVWELCGRGILRPALSRSQGDRVAFNGREFVITEYGDHWLREERAVDVIPAESGRFAGALGSYALLFGPAYQARSQEALACYQAHAFLACCAMCGAAAEAILLLIAIEKRGDRDQVMRAYRGGSGRSQIERIVTEQLNSHLREELLTFTALLKYWRDGASHATDSRLTEQEAFVAMLLLLRFAAFAYERWEDITGSPRPR